MPLPGGPANKVGNRYENMWTVLNMTEVMDEEAKSIRIEPPGAEGIAAEFWLQKQEEREYHQVKLRTSGRGNWTANSLASGGVLPKFLVHLETSEDAICVFVSAHTASPLDELATRARDAQDFDEFRKEFLKPNHLKLEFNQLRAVWHRTEEQTFGLLRRMRVKTIDETTLRETVDRHIDDLVDGDTPTARDILAQFALNSVHQELGAHNIWEHLENRPGFRRKQWANDPRSLPRVEDATARYLRPIDKAAIGGKPIPRSEADRAAESLRSTPDEKRCVVLTGTAGSGKSGIAAQIVRMLEADGWPVLAFRVDRLDVTFLPKEVGGQLDLPGSPPQVLAAVAADRECLLVIDQLDAVSIVSGRNPAFLECIDEIIEQALLHSNVRLLLSCRDFDLNNDFRLQKLATEHAKQVVIGALPPKTICDVVSEAGINAQALSQKQVELLSLPLHLSLFLQVAGNAEFDSRSVESSKDLFDAFWTEKRRSLREGHGRTLNWDAVMDALCDYMSQHQVLYAPLSAVDEHREDADAMASENVLTIDEDRVQFFHETFFDYAFARRFATRGGSVHELLLSAEQHLFRRAQLRQILVYQRDHDLDQYLGDLRVLLHDQRVRFQMKKVVLSILAGLQNPSDREWQILAELLQERSAHGWRSFSAHHLKRILTRLPQGGSAQGWRRVCHGVVCWMLAKLSQRSLSPTSRVAWETISGSSPWFRLLDSLGVLERWLASEDEDLVNRTVTLLRTVLDTESPRVTQLAEPYVGKSEEWDNRVRFLVMKGNIGASREFFDFFLRLIDNGTLDDAHVRNSDFWSLLYRVRHAHSDWCCEAIAHYLHRRLNLCLDAGQINPFDRATGTISSRPAEELLHGSATSDPSGFIRQNFPFMLRVMNVTAPDGEVPRKDPVWEYRSRGAGYDIKYQLLDSMEQALRLLAESSPLTLSEVIQEFNLEASPFETVQFLLIRAYAANGQAFANTAADYLCALPARLSIDYVDGELWATRELLQQITPHCFPERLARLERAILDYYPDYELKANGREHRGHAQFILLDAIDPTRRSQGATAKLREWQHKFDMTKVSTPRVRWGGGAVTSPISASSAAKMTDEQWLTAVAKYHTDDHRYINWEDGHVLGGAHELSLVLEQLVTRDPERFYPLLMRFPANTNPAYFSAVLNGLGKTSVSPKVITDACAHCHNLPNRPVGRSIARLIERMAGQPVPDELLDILVWYATKDADPDKEYWRTRTSSGDVYYGGDIIMAGLNCVRGGAAETIARLIFEDPSLVDRLRSALEEMVKDPIIAVRAWTAHTLIPILNFSRDYAVDLFLRLCETEDVLLGTRFVEEFLGWASRTHFHRLRPLLERMLQSSCQEASEAGARQACLAGLYVEGAQDLIQRCIKGSEAERVGAAEVFATNLKRADFRSLCERSLITLFNDSSKKVREAAADCFRRVHNADFSDFKDLTLAFINSPAFKEGFGHLLFALEDSTSAPPELVCTACEKFIELAGAEASDISRGVAIEASQVSKLILRAYASTSDEGVKTKCLDVIDRLLEVGAWGIEEALHEHER